MGLQRSKQTTFQRSAPKCRKNGAASRGPSSTPDASARRARRISSTLLGAAGPRDIFRTPSVVLRWWMKIRLAEGRTLTPNVATPVSQTLYIRVPVQCRRRSTSCVSAWLTPQNAGEGGGCLPDGAVGEMSAFQRRLHVAVPEQAPSP